MDLSEILRDLNVTIADVESSMIELSNPLTIGDFKRAIGQLKAARTSLIGAHRLLLKCERCGSPGRYPNSICPNCAKATDFGTKEDFINKWTDKESK